jgi:hypothetical protein
MTIAQSSPVLSMPDHTHLPDSDGVFVKNFQEHPQYPIKPLGAELGIWHGKVDNHNLPWLRWWDSNGSLLLTRGERAEVEKQPADTEKQRADRLAAKLQEMGVNPQDV